MSATMLQLDLVVQGVVVKLETSRLTEGGEVVIFTLRPPFTPTKIPAIHFCWRLSETPGPSAALRIRSIEKSSELIGNRTSVLLPCVP